MGKHTLATSTLARTLSQLLTDFTDLLQKEIRLARAEISEKISSRLQAGAWMGAAGLLAFVAALLVIEGIVFALVAWGLSPYLSCFVVAGVIALLAVAFFYHARSLLADDLLPARTARQLSQDIKTAKEQLT